MVGRVGMVLCLVGPAGGGKTTFCHRLLQEFPNDMRLSISATTRPPRPGERDGVSYYYLTEQEFKSRVEAGKFFEWEEIHGRRYGTLQETVDSAIQTGKDLLLDIDIKGALNFKRRLPEHTVLTFLVPPSPEVLKSRVLGRGGVSPSELDVRLRTAAQEYSQLLSLADKPGAVDYFIVNDVADATYETLRSVVLAERTRLIRLKKADVQAVCRLN